MLSRPRNLGSRIFSVAEASDFMTRKPKRPGSAHLLGHIPWLVWVLFLLAATTPLLGCGGTTASASGPDLTLSISHQSSTQGATFDISINNAGNGVVNGPVTLTLSGTVVPPAVIAPGGGWNCVASSAPGSPPQFAVCTNPGPIPPGGGGILSVSYNITTVFLSGNPVNPPTSFGLSISAHASAPGNISAGASDGVSIPLAPAALAALSFQMNHVGPSFIAGGTGNYVFAVQNTSEAESDGSVDVTLNLPPGFTYASSSGTGWICGGGQVIGCIFTGTIAPGATSEFTLNVLVEVPVSGMATSSWSTSLDEGKGPSLLMSDVVLVEAPADRR